MAIADSQQHIHLPRTSENEFGDALISVYIYMIKISLTMEASEVPSVTKKPVKESSVTETKCLLLIFY